jgi:hypothetical protein
MKTFGALLLGMVLGFSIAGSIYHLPLTFAIPVLIIGIVGCILMVVGGKTDGVPTS